MIDARFLQPAHQNHVQRAGFAFTLISIVVLIFLHNPFDGYVTQKLATRTDWKAKDCSADDKEKMHELVSKQDLESRLRWQELFRKCVEVTARTELEDIPFENWSSKEPHVSWLGSVLHLLEAIVAILVIGIIWLFAFATSKPVRAKDN